jgi:lysophospholipase L1-like esterase
VRRRLLFGLLIPSATVLTLAAATEAALRVAFANSLDFGIEMWKYAAQLKQTVPNPRIGFVHRPNSSAFLMHADVSINSRGLRDREYSVEKPPGTYRIMMLGDSTTFGWGVPIGDTAAKQLERGLNAAGGRHVEVLNAGVGNYNTVQEVSAYVERGRLYRPDLVVLVYFINDAEPTPVDQSGWLRNRSYFLAFALSRYDALLRLTGRRPGWRAYYESLYADSQPGWPAAASAIGELSRETRRDGANLLVAILPELHEINGDYPFTRAHAMVRAAAARENVPAVDLIDGLRNHGPESTLWVTPLDDHPNGKANTLIAAQLRVWILANEATP